MWAHGVVKRLNVTEYGQFSGLPRREMRKMEALALEAGEEILSDSVIVRVAFAGHALTKMAGLETISEGN